MEGITEPVVKFKKRQRKIQSRKCPESPTGSQSGSAPSDDDNNGRPSRRDKRTKTATGSEASGIPPSSELYPTVFVADRSVHVAAQDNTATAPARPVGPARVASNVRTTIFTDYSPDVCKDYKQTGFCGFGDNCKFLHSREDYKQGWQLDREWEIATKGRKSLGGTTVAHADRSGGVADKNNEEGQEGEGADNISPICAICEESYTSPVVTRCGHYFCESCALIRYRKDPSCAVCGAATNGIFNSAKQLQRALDEKAAKERRDQSD